MATWARNINNVAVDVVTTNPILLFHSIVASEFITVSDGTKNGWVYNPSDQTWSSPPAPPDPPQEYRTTLTRSEFMMLFTSAERIAIRGHGVSIDPGVEDFLLIINDPTAASIDITHAEVIGGVNYLTTVAIPNSSPVAYLLTTDRAATILLGKPI